MGDSFESSLFKSTYQRVFAKDDNQFLKQGYNAILEIKVTSRHDRTLKLK